MAKRPTAPNSVPKKRGVPKPLKQTPKAPVTIHGNTSRDHIYRIYKILSELQNLRHPSREQLADICGVSTKTIERDLRSMESLMDVDIVYDQSKRGYKIKGKVQHFPMLKLEERDLLTLHFLRQCLAPYDGTDIGRSMIESFNRAFGLLTGTTCWQNWEDTVWFRFDGKPEIAKGDVALFNLLYKAIRKRSVVSFAYCPPSNKKCEGRSVEPLFIFMRNGRWFLHAVNHGTDEQRNFVFARITKAELTGETFTAREINPGKTFRYSFGVVSGEERPKENVILDFAPSVAIRIRETIWHPEQTIKDLAGGGVLLNLPIAEASYLELKPWLLSWGDTVSVVAPESLKEELKASVTAMAKRAGIL
jgi:predicted DNA-binding transcriptional regulator YafY